MLMILFSCKKEEHAVHEDGYYWILSYGYPNMATDAGREGISEKRKIKYFRIAECEISKELMDSVAVENMETHLAIEGKYGKSWKAKYEQEVSGFVMKSVDVMDVLITNKVFRDELKKYNIEIDGIDKKLKELNDEGLYEVVVYNNAIKAENKKCFAVHVDTKNRIVNLIQ